MQSVSVFPKEGPWLLVKVSCFCDFSVIFLMVPYSVVGTLWFLQSFLPFRRIPCAPSNELHRTDDWRSVSVSISCYMMPL